LITPPDQPSILILTLTHRPPRPPLFPYTTALPIWPAELLDGLERGLGCGRVVSQLAAQFGAPPQRVGGKRQPQLFSEQLEGAGRSEEHTSELQSPYDLVCRLLLEKKKRVQGRKSSN